MRCNSNIYLARTRARAQRAELCAYILTVATTSASALLSVGVRAELRCEVGMRAARSRSRTLAGWRLKRARVYVRTVRMRVKVSGPCAKQNIINKKQCARFADLLNCFSGPRSCVRRRRRHNY